jgi:hypothetical protein
VVNQRILRARLGAHRVDDHEKLDVLVRRRREPLPLNAVCKRDRLALASLEHQVRDAASFISARSRLMLFTPVKRSSTTSPSSFVMA